MFEEAVDGGVARERLHQRAAGILVLLAGLEEGLEHHQVRHEVDERVAREVLAGPPVPELALVARENGSGEVVPGMRLVGPGSGQASRLQSVTDALAAYRVDHAPSIPDCHDALIVALRAPHAHLEGPASRRSLRS